MNLEKSISSLNTKMEGWLESIITNLPNFLLAIIAFFIIMYAAKLIRKLLGKVLDKVGSSKAFNQLILNVYSLTIFTLALIIALSIMNLDTTVKSLLAGAGIVGFILGFAFQDIVANMFSGAVIALRKPFLVDDIIETNGKFGRVVSIRLINTELHDLAGNIVLIPSREILRTGIVNYTGMGVKRITLPVGISYAEDLDKVRQVTLEALGNVKEILREREIEFYYTDFGDSSINFEVRFWIIYTKEADSKEARSKAIMNIKSAFNKNDITIPFPIRTLDFGIKGGKTLSQIYSRDKRAL